MTVPRENEELVRLLLRHNASPGSTDDSGSTPLLYAVMYTANDLALATILLEYETTTDAQSEEESTVPHHTTDIVDGAGFTALHRSVLIDSTELISLLIAKKANLDVKTENGRTALQLAVLRENQGITELLVNSGATRRARCRRLYSPPPCATEFSR
ncbi:ankyrin repeat-containing domain protein [Tricharina praecox]|uniref:ankyrin repeat-containing domain protein n=1 Tax=Tricharina praecox TaxID=43433 RepID=UPI00221FD621|nr:ankyrin repeat-containing domain protein [Tricharina praecox]KAI5850716.1 ankyrin repeat-containing domain protein [Tricharina praecox]